MQGRETMQKPCTSKQAASQGRTTQHKEDSHNQFQLFIQADTAQPCKGEKPANHDEPQASVNPMQKTRKTEAKQCRDVEAMQDHAREFTPAEPFKMQHCKPGDFFHGNTI